jgi:hypothetical protein
MGKKKCRVYKKLPTAQAGLNFSGVNQTPSYMQGGSNSAPQNATIDSMGKQRTDLTKNFIAANAYKSMLDQQALELERQMGQFAAGGENGSFYNPNRQLMESHMRSINDRKKQFGKDWRGFTNALGDIEPQEEQYQGPQGTTNDMNFMQQNLGYGVDAPIGTSYAMDDQGNESSFAPGANPYAPMEYAYGGDLPMAKIGTSIDGLDPIQAAFRQRKEKAAQAAAHKKWIANSNGPRYGQDLVSQVGQPNPLMMDMYPNASSADGVSSGLNWGEYQAEQNRLAGLASPYARPSIIDNAWAPPSFNYLNQQAPVAQQPVAAQRNEQKEYWDKVMQGNNNTNSAAVLDAMDRQAWAKAAGKEDVTDHAGTAKKIAATNPTPGTKKGTDETITEQNKIMTDNATDKPVVETADRTGNDGDDAVDNTGNRSSTSTARTYNTLGQGYGQDNRKYKARGYTIDPVTGKKQRFRWKSKPGAGGGNNNFYGQGRNGYPRKVKNTYNIYNGQGMTPYTPREWDNNTTDGQVAGTTFNELPENAGFDIPNNDPSFGGRTESAFAPGANQWYDPSQFNPGAGKGDFELRNPQFERPVEEDGLAPLDTKVNGKYLYDDKMLSESDRTERTFTDMLAKDEAKADARAAAKAARGERRDDRREARDARRNKKQFGGEESYFYANGGGYDPNNPYGMLPQAQWGQETTNQFGNNYDQSFGQGPSSAGNSQYTQTGQIKTKDKAVGNFMQDAGRYKEAGLMGVNAFAAGLENRDTSAEDNLANMRLADNAFALNDGVNHGGPTANQGYDYVGQTTVVPFKGNNQGYPGSDDYYSQFGGEQDGEYLSEQEIQQIMAMGGSVEYL